MFREAFGDGSAFGLSPGLHDRGDAARHRRRHPQRRRGADLRPGRRRCWCSTATSCPATTSVTQVGMHVARRAAVTLHLTEVDDPLAVRLRADRRRRPGDRVPGEDPEPGHQPDQRRMLRLPRSVDRRDPGGRGRLGRAGDVPRPDRAPAPWCIGYADAPTGSTWAPPPPSSRARATWCSAGCVSPALPGPGGGFSSCPAPWSRPEAKVAGGTASAPARWWSRARTVSAACWATTAWSSRARRGRLGGRQGRPRRLWRGAARGGHRGRRDGRRGQRAAGGQPHLAGHRASADRASASPPTSEPGRERA